MQKQSNLISYNTFTLTMYPTCMYEYVNLQYFVLLLQLYLFKIPSFFSMYKINFDQLVTSLANSNQANMYVFLSTCIYSVCGRRRMEQCSPVPAEFTMATDSVACSPSCSILYSANRRKRIINLVLINLGNGI